MVTDSSNTVIASYTYTPNADGLRTSALEYQKNTDGTYTDTLITYHYDNDGRLISEDHDDGNNGPSSGDETITYAFDLANNRTRETINLGDDGTIDETVTYLYNSNDELLTETSDTVPAHDKTYHYNDNGSTTSIATGAPGSTQTVNYTWDLRNRMVGVDANGSVSGGNGSLSDPGDTVYTYDTNGVRESEVVVGSGGTYYLNDPLNPTGYTKAIEEQSLSGAAPTRSYILGLRVEGQSDATNGTLYLLTDGHGSTRAVVNTSGGIVERYDYDAFGNSLEAGPVIFNPSTAKTPWLFGGDGLYDPSSGFTYQLARWRDDFRFESQDTYMGDPASPLSVHKYVYANQDPIIKIDPTGRDSQTAWDSFWNSFVNASYGSVGALTGGCFDTEYGFFGYSSDVKQWLNGLGFQDDNTAVAYKDGTNGTKVFIALNLGGAAPAEAGGGGRFYGLLIFYNYFSVHIRRHLQPSELLARPVLHHPI